MYHNQYEYKLKTIIPANNEKTYPENVNDDNAAIINKMINAARTQRTDHQKY